MAIYSMKREDIKGDTNTPKKMETRNPLDLIAGRLTPNNPKLKLSTKDLLDMGLDVDNKSKFIDLFSKTSTITNIGDLFKKYNTADGLVPIYKALGLDISKLPSNIIVQEAKDALGALYKDAKKSEKPTTEQINRLALYINKLIKDPSVSEARKTQALKYVLIPDTRGSGMYGVDKETKKIQTSGQANQVILMEFLGVKDFAGLVNLMNNVDEDASNEQVAGVVKGATQSPDLQDSFRSNETILNTEFESEMRDFIKISALVFRKLSKESLDPSDKQRSKEMADIFDSVEREPSKSFQYNKLTLEERKSVIDQIKNAKPVLQKIAASRFDDVTDKEMALVEDLYAVFLKLKNKYSDSAFPDMPTTEDLFGDLRNQPKSPEAKNEFPVIYKNLKSYSTGDEILKIVIPGDQEITLPILNANRFNRSNETTTLRANTGNGDEKVYRLKNGNELLVRIEDGEITFRSKKKVDFTINVYPSKEDTIGEDASVRARMIDNL